MHTDYDDKASANIVAPLFAAKTEHVYPIPAASSNLRNMQCAAGLKVEGSNNFCLSGSGPASTHGTVGHFCGTECVACPASTHSSEAGSLNHHVPLEHLCCCDQYCHLLEVFERPVYQWQDRRNRV